MLTNSWRLNLVLMVLTIHKLNYICSAVVRVIARSIISSVLLFLTCCLNSYIASIKDYVVLWELFRSSITDTARLQATLPIQLSGLGLREAFKTSLAAFVGSCNFTRFYCQDILSHLHVCRFLGNRHSSSTLNFSNKSRLN